MFKDQWYQDINSPQIQLQVQCTKWECMEMFLATLFVRIIRKL